SSGPLITAMSPEFPLGEKYAWNGSPYSDGVARRCARLAPKTAVAHNAATAIAVPASAVPAGCPDRPRSSACRRPISALTGGRAAGRSPRGGRGGRGRGPPGPPLLPAPDTRDAAGGRPARARGAPRARPPGRSPRPAPPARRPGG